MSIIDKQIEIIKEEIPRLANLADEYLFSLVCYQFFYNQGKLSYGDYSEVFVDGKNDGGIDLLTLVEDTNGQTSLVLIQSKKIASLKNSQEVIDIVRKMAQTVDDFKNSKTSKYNRRLKQRLKDRLAEIEDQSASISLVVFLNVDVSDNLREKIIDIIENREELSDYDVSIFYKKDIEEQISNMLEPHRYVKEAKIKICKEDGRIKYGENGLLVNLYASSLRDLYDRFKDKGLFEQNFRYYIRNKRIDDNIKNSLNKKRKEFWFLNNGIIIGCSDFIPDGDYIRLYNFSIINGCQTTTLIGEYKGKNENVDFVLPCKIVKPLNNTDENFDRFISEIAESSNSQKPISDRDLKSNKPEQRKLQTLLKETAPKVYLEIKKGQEINRKNVESWQVLNNELLGQLVLSFNLQQPGTARSNKKRIFSDENVYSRVFKRSYSKQNVIDLLKLNNYYKVYLDKNAQYDDIITESVSTNGKLFVIAIIGFMIKYKRGLIDLQKLNNSNEWEDHIREDNLDGGFFKNDYHGDDFEDRLYSLFSNIVYELSDLYQRRAEEEKAVSNFFKTDAKYQSVIVKHFIQRFIKTPMTKKEIDQLMAIFN